MTATRVGLESVVASNALPPEAFAAALASLDGMGPARLLALLNVWTAPDAWRAVVDGRCLDDPKVRRAMVPEPRNLSARWRAQAESSDVPSEWSRYVAAGIGVAGLRSAAYPAALATDLEPPGVVFFRGDPTVISGPRVAIVGTRRATRYGLDVAFELGRDLAAAGVAVVSGLALGIDDAAHAGAIHAATTPPIAVVGSGLDVIYPRRNAVLWREVERRGVVLSEAPLGARPVRWRFPARNRLIAALADAVVVVESAAAGGSLLTVTEAQRRDRLVYAVPGPVRSETSVGTNRLLRDGASPACDASDVLVGLGMSAALSRPVRDVRTPPDADDARVLDALGWQPTSMEQVVLRVGEPLGAVALALARLEAEGWVTSRAGWYERVARAEP